MNKVYASAEDSLLLLKHTKNLVNGYVLDMGAGSGIQAVEAAKKPEVIKVVAVDVNPEALIATEVYAKKEKVIEKIQLIESDLFTKVEGLFDWILFNPPYLPSEEKIFDQTWDGGGKGVEVIEKFLNTAKEHMKPNSSILIIYSSETELDENYGYNWLILEELPLFFETIYCAQLTLINPF